MQHAGSAVDVLEDDLVGRLKVFVYELPSKYKKEDSAKGPKMPHPHVCSWDLYASVPII